LPNIKRWLDVINARPAAQSAEALKAQFDFKMTVDADALRHLFPANAKLGL
jgi:GST-like protein